MKRPENRIILITGAVGGLGKKISMDLAARGTELVLHVRSPEKEKAAIFLPVLLLVVIKYDMR